MQCCIVWSFYNIFSLILTRIWTQPGLLGANPIPKPAPTPIEMPFITKARWRFNFDLACSELSVNKGIKQTLSHIDFVNK
jgi:hypothetical protein